MKMKDENAPTRSQSDGPSGSSDTADQVNANDERPLHNENEVDAESFQQGSVASEVPKSSQSPDLSPTNMRAVHGFVDDCIELRRLHRFFGETKAVDDISFTVKRGHVFGYIGPNGAGKTTSMRILATLDLPSYGDAYVDGFSCVNDPELVRQRLGFMPDSFGTYRDVNCQEYLDFFARAYGLVGQQRIERLRRVLEFTGTDAMAEKPIRGLSKGMKQRLCLGRALIHDPAVMILDEPAAGLDPRARIHLRRMIRELADEGKTILISSHILTELAEMCDSVGIIEQGKLLAIGSVDEIQHQRSQDRELTIRVLVNSEAAAESIKADDMISSLVVDGQLIRFEFTGDLKDQASLVAFLVSKGFEIAEVTSQKKSLEDVFLQVTEGLVQ